MKLEAKSLAIGAMSSFVGLALIAAAAPQSVGQVLRTVVVRPVQVEGLPRPDQLIRIEAGKQFTVPTGKSLVMTGVVLGDTAIPGYQPSATWEIDVDGTVRLSGSYYTGAAQSPSSGNNWKDSTVFFWGDRVDSGSVVSITPAPCIILGYLAD